MKKLWQTTYQVQLLAQPRPKVWALNHKSDATSTLVSLNGAHTENLDVFVPTVFRYHRQLTILNAC